MNKYNVTMALQAFIRYDRKRQIMEKHKKTLDAALLKLEPTSERIEYERLVEKWQISQDGELKPQE